MAFTVISYDRETQTDPIPFDTFGTVTGLTYDHSWPGGCLTAQWQVDLPAHWSDRAATPGRLVSIYCGALRVWRGQLTEPDRGTPWTFHAEGLQAATAGYAAVTRDSDSDPWVSSTDPNDVLAHAQPRGLPIAAVDLLPTPTLTDVPATFADLLNEVAFVQGQRWGVDRDAHLTMIDDPTTVDYLYAAVDTFGRTPDGYATDIFIKYVDSTTHTVLLMEGASNPDDAAPRPFGRVEQIVDLTDDGEMSSTEAQAIAAGAVPLLGQHLNYTNGLTCVPRQLLSPGGLPVSLATVRAGQVLRLLGVQPQTALGEVAYTAGVTVVTGQTSYDATADTVTLTPLAATRRDLVGLVQEIWTRLDPIFKAPAGYRVH